MKRNLVTCTSVLISLAMSTASLAWQVQHARSGSKFEKYMGPANLTALQYGFLLADVHMLSNATPVNKGMGVPNVYGLSKDNNHIIVRVLVLPDDLPSDFETRRRAFWMTAASASAALAASFEPNLSPDDDVVVEFIDAVKSFVRKEFEPVVVATYKNGKLTFH